MRAKWLSQALVLVGAVLLLSATASAVVPGQTDLRGKIEAVAAAPPAVTVMGQVVAVDLTPGTGTLIQDEKVLPPTVIAFSLLLVGDTVHVQAITLPDGTLQAREIDRENELEIEGVSVRAAIDTIDPATTSFTAGGMKVVTNATTVFQKKKGVADFSALAVGTIVEVEGSTQADGSLLASKIGIEDALDRKNVDITADVHGAGGNFIIEVGQKITVKPTTVIFGKLHKRISLAEIQLGDSVHAEAVEVVGSGLVAKKLTDTTRTALRAKHITGKVTAKTQTSIKVGGKVFLIPPATQMQDAFGRKIGFNKIRVGTTVNVEVVTIGDNKVARGITKR